MIRKTQFEQQHTKMWVKDSQSIGSLGVMTVSDTNFEGCSFVSYASFLLYSRNLFFTKIKNSNKINFLKNVLPPNVNLNCPTTNLKCSKVDDKILSLNNCVGWWAGETFSNNNTMRCRQIIYI